MERKVYTSVDFRLQHLTKYNVRMSRDADSKYLVAKIGYYRLAQIAKRIHQRAPQRVVTIEQLIDIFQGEQQLREKLNVLISYFEIEFRSLLSEYYGQWFGAHGFIKEEHFLDQKLHQHLIYKVKKQLDNQALYEVIDDERHTKIETLPIWVALELSTFHMLTLFYAMLAEEQKKIISKHYGCDFEVFAIYLDFLLVVRNACAHQGLLFGRKFRRQVLWEGKIQGNIMTAVGVLKRLLKNSTFPNQVEFFQSCYYIEQLKGFYHYYNLSDTMK